MDGAKIRLANKKRGILEDYAEKRMKAGKKLQVTDELWEEYQGYLSDGQDLDPSAKWR